MKIKRLKAQTILSSNGTKTIEITVNGKYTASAPSGTSKGKYEVRSFPSTGVPTSVVNRTLSKKLIGIKIGEFNDLEQVEGVLNEYGFNKVGGNTVVAIEFALLKAISNNELWSYLNNSVDIMPKLLGNCVGGGAHFKGESTDFQEFLIQPEVSSVRDADIINKKIYSKIGEVSKAKQKTLEGAWVLQQNSEDVFKMIDKISYDIANRFGIRVHMGADIAANTLFKNNLYHYKNKMRSKDEQLEYVNGLVDRFNLKYIEDPVMEEDFEGYGEIKAKLVCGDDLVCTNLKRLESAKEYISAVIVKPNQVGSLIETKKLVDYAKANGIVTVMSHRSGETMDTTIADLAVGWEIPYIKCGIVGKERVVKLNRLKNIEKNIK